MAESVVARVNYFDHQYLRTQDFVDDQAYHLAMQRRHRMAEHIWGIVAGLAIVQDKDKNVIIQPGIAIDGYGRELVLREGFTVAPGRFDQVGADVLEAWLVYNRTDTEGASGGYASCNANASTPYRSEERGQVELLAPSRFVVPDPQEVLLPRRQSPDVPAEDLNFDPTRIPPDDSAGYRWPVYLGRIQRSRAKPPTYAISLTGRPYAGLVGEAIIHPADRGAISMPANPSGKAVPGANQGASDPLRLPAIGLGSQPAGADLFFEVSLFNPDLARRERRLSLDTAGNWQIRGDAEVRGDVIVDGGAVEFRAGPAYDASMPWRIYHVRPLAPPSTSSGQTSTDGKQAITEPNGGAYESQAQSRGAATTTDSGQSIEDELRIELPSLADNQAGRLVIGKWSDDKKQFMPCLTVANDCTVTVYGNLVVQGQICGDIDKQSDVSKGLTTAAQQTKLAALTAGAQSVFTPQYISSISPAPTADTSATASALVEALKSELQNSEIYKNTKDILDKLTKLITLPPVPPTSGGVADHPAAAPVNEEASAPTESDQGAAKAGGRKVGRSPRSRRNPQQPAAGSLPPAPEGGGQPGAGESGEAPANSG
jgi:hypothetical protein